MVEPKQSKGKKKKYVVACVAWMDLLGYGSMLTNANFSPKDPTTNKAVQRLRHFQKITAQQAAKSFPVMQLNDGVAFFTDLSRRSTSVTTDFLQRSIKAFELVNKKDKASGNPGARMVIAVGPRARISRPRRSTAHLKNIFQKLTEGFLEPKQAVHEAFRAIPIAGFVPQLQANFAFTRAYLANEAGTKKGFGGCECYIDTTLFEQRSLPWISFGRNVPFKDKGLCVDFKQYVSVDWKSARKTEYKGIRSTASIASKLGMNTNHCP